MFLVGEINHLGDDEKIVVVLFNLWALTGVDHVFQGQRVEIKTLSQNAEDAQVTQAIDINPSDKLVIKVAKKFAAIDVLPLIEVIWPVLNQGDDRSFLGRILRKLE